MALMKLKRAIKTASTRSYSRLIGGPEKALCQLTALSPVTPERLLLCYAQGMFPMVHPDGSTRWDSPERRAGLAPGDVHLSRRLKGYVRKSSFEIGFDENFDEVVARCAERDLTWITSGLMETYHELFEWGVSHSVEVLDEGRLVGGGFGLCLGPVFFLDSMYSAVDHASKIAFVRLAEKLAEDGFTWIDLQFLTEHWKRFGAEEVERGDLVRRIARGLHAAARFSRP